MNRSPLNAAAINSAVDPMTTVRIMITALASALMLVQPRVWRRSMLAGNVSAQGSDGRVWRKSPVGAYAEASVSLANTLYRHVRSLVSLFLRADTGLTAFVKPRTSVGVQVSVVAAAGGSATATSINVPPEEHPFDTSAPPERCFYVVGNHTFYVVE